MRIIFLLLVGLGLGLWVSGTMAVSWPTYYELIVPEDAPMRWLQALLLAGAALMAVIHVFRARLSRAPRLEVVSWVALAAAFAFLCLDERFQIHEKARLVPEAGIPVLSSIDAEVYQAVLPIYVLAGLLFVPLVWRLFRSDRLVLGIFIVGAAFAAAAVGVDYVERPSIAGELVDPPLRVLEELLELGAFASFFSLGVVHLFKYLPVSDPDMLHEMRTHYDGESMLSTLDGGPKPALVGPATVLSSRESSESSLSSTD